MRDEMMIKKILNILEIIFLELTIVGVIYIIKNRGEVSIEYAVIPCLCNIVLMLVDKNMNKQG